LEPQGAPSAHGREAAIPGLCNARQHLAQFLLTSYPQTGWRAVVVPGGCRNVLHWYKTLILLDKYKLAENARNAGVDNPRRTDYTGAPLQ
jgi:hypothetical protein